MSTTKAPGSVRRVFFAGFIVPFTLELARVSAIEICYIDTRWRVVRYSSVNSGSFFTVISQLVYACRIRNNNARAFVSKVILVLVVQPLILNTIRGENQTSPFWADIVLSDLCTHAFYIWHAI